MDEVARYACSIDVSMDEKYYFNDDKGVLQSADNLLFSYSYNRWRITLFEGRIHLLVFFRRFHYSSLFLKKYIMPRVIKSQGGIINKRVYISPADWNNCLSGGYM